MKDEDREDAQKCDEVIKQALGHIQAAGIPMHVTIDRLLTYAAYASVVTSGKTHTAEQFLNIADAVAGGVFDGVGRNGNPVGRG